MRFLGSGSAGRLTRQAALTIALVCGFLAAIGAWLWISQQQKAAPPVAATVDIPVPIRAIPAQSELRPSMFQNMAVEKDKVPSDVVTNAQAFQGRVSVVDLPAGQVVKVSSIDLKTRMGLAFGVPRGMRAMAVPLDIVGAVGDFIKPGNNVDVLVSFEKEGQFVIRTVAQNVMVMAVGDLTSAQPPAEEEGEDGAKPEAKARKAETPVTLALTPTQTQIILAADVAGDLRLALRANGDTAVSPLPPGNSWSLIGKVPVEGKDGATPVQPPVPTPTPQPAVTPPGPQPPSAWGAPPAVPQAPRRPSVEVIRGGEREIVTP